VSFIGIDIGATFVKGAVLDIGRMRLLGTVRYPFPAFVPGLPAGHREVLWSQIETVVGKVLAELSKLAGSSATVLISNQMHGFILCNDSGNPLGNFISWQDTRTIAHHRGQPFFESLCQQVPQDILIEIGRELKPGHPNAVLAWLQLQGQLPANAVVCSLGDCVAARLANVFPFTDPSNAAASGLFDVAHNCWHSRLLRILNLEAIRLPEVISAIHDGSTGSQSGIASVRAPVGDQQAALLGVGLGNGELSINVATGSQVGMLALTFPDGQFQVRPYFDNRFLKTITHLPAGRALQVLTRLLTEFAGNSDSQKSDCFLEYALSQAEQCDGNGLQCSLSFFPCATGTAGSLFNMREDNLTAGNLFRSALETMADNYKQCADRIDPSRHSQRVVFSGGLAQKSALLRQLIAQRLNLPVREAFHPEDALNGLLVLARCCADHAPTSSVVHLMGSKV